MVGYPERRSRQLFVREGGDVRFRRGLPSASAISKLLRPTTLVLSLASRMEVPELAGPARFLSGITNPFPARRYRRGFGVGPARMYGRGPILNSTNRLFLDAYRAENDRSAIRPFRPSRESDIRAARSMLRHADLGIWDVLVKEEQDSEYPDRARLDLRLVHGVADETAEFDLGEESDGTQMWFRLIGPALAALRYGRPLLLDEIDASLHPKLSAELLEVFRNPSTNPRNAQLIFTTHDTTLMGELNRDEVWLTEKGEDGATRLTALAEFGGDKVRRSLNLERAYLQGRFGAIPRLGSRPLDQYLVEVDEAEYCEDEYRQSGVDDAGVGSDEAE